MKFSRSMVPVFFFHLLWVTSYLAVPNTLYYRDVPTHVHCMSNFQGLGQSINFSAVRAGCVCMLCFGFY